jgi:hypothetical protein
MSNTDWRISGAVTDDFTVEQLRDSRVQTLSQGIGYNLRPVSNVPLEDTGGIINEETIATGLFMTWIGDWQEGKYHPRGSVCAGEGWQMIANKLTLEYPFPTPAGNNEFALAGWTPVAQSNLSVVFSGHKYVLNEPVWIRAINIWVTELTADTNYRIVVGTKLPTDDEITFTALEEPVLVENTWVTVTAPNKLYPAGTELLIYIDALNSGSSVSPGGTPADWGRSADSNNGPALTGQWSTNNLQNVLRINQLTADNETINFVGTIPGSTFLFTSTTDGNSFARFVANSSETFDPVAGDYEWSVALDRVGANGAPAVGQRCLVEIEVPVAAATQYAEQAGSNPAYIGPNVTVTPYLAFNGIDQGATNTSFGVDLEIESSTVPEDWDPMSYSTP